MARLVSMRSLIAVLAVAIVTASCASASSSPDPRALTLKLRDFPAGWQIDKAYYRTNDVVVKDGSTTRAQVKAWGRISGYALDASEGLHKVESRASVYETSAGADVSLDQTRAHCGKSPLRRVSLGGVDLGHRPCFAVQRIRRNGVSTETWVVAWRRGRLTGAVLAASLPGGLRPGDVLKLAKKEDAKLLRAAQ